MVEFNEKQRAYSDYRQQLLSRQLSNSENFDKSILQLSTAGLGFSLAFLKDLIPLAQAKFISILFISWCLFAAAIFSTLLSYFASQRAITRQLEYAERYYIQDQEEYGSRRNYPALITIFLNRLAGVFYIFAVLVTITFVIVNLD